MKKIMKRCLGIALVVAGIGIILYPVYTKYTSTKEQNQLLSEVYKKIDENKKNLNDDRLKTPQPSTEFLDVEPETTMHTQEQENLEEAYVNLELEENNEVIEGAQGEERKNQTIKEVLSYQTLLGVIQIEKLNIEFPIVEGSERSNIAVSIGHMKNSVPLGAKGNSVLAGHRGGIYGVFFRDVDQLEVGDEVKVTNMEGEVFVYKMYDSFLVKPNAMWVVDNIKDEYTLTLVTCENESMERRIIRCRME